MKVATALPISPAPTKMGNIKNDSSALVAAGLKSFRQLVLGSLAAGAEVEPEQVSQEEIDGLPTLRGQFLPIYKVFRKLETGYVEESIESMHIPKVVVKLAEEQSLKKLVSIGPGAADILPEERSGILEEVQLFESIDMDPLLSWFWQSIDRLNATA